MDSGGYEAGIAVSMILVAVIFFLALLGAGVLTYLARRAAIRHRLLDIPNARSSHSTPTPRGGGIAIVLVVISALIFCALTVHGFFLAGLVTAMAGAAVAYIGFVDDRRGLTPLTRFAIHVAAVAAVVATTGYLGPLHVPGFSPDSLAGGLVAAVALVWLVNLVNFMDGIDGIAAVEVSCVSAGLAYCAHDAGSGAGPVLIVSMASAGAALGFLAWNWPPARIFMGDVGSGFAGFMLGALALLAHRMTGLSLWVPVILLAVFASDATVTLLRRAVRGERWYLPHRSHAYQRLSRRFKSHRTVTLGVLAINLAWLFPLAVLATRNLNRAAAIAAVAYLPVVALAWWAGAGRRETEIDAD